MGENTWHSEVPNHTKFKESLESLRTLMSKDKTLRQDAIDLFVSAKKYQFGYHSDWLGVPIIRLAEDLIREQEIIFREKPDLIIEIGVARGGGLLFAASMQQICSIAPNVVGIDNRFFPHTLDAIRNSEYREVIRLLEADSDSDKASQFVADNLRSVKKALLILDSDHSSKHVFSELQTYFKLLPTGSTIMVCDTIIDEMPVGSFSDRTWADGEGPGHAVKAFLEVEKRAVLDVQETDDLLLSEMRGGIIRKV